MSATLIMLNNTKINANWRKVDRGGKAEAMRLVS